MKPTMARFSSRDAVRKMREAQQKLKREADRVNRENRKAVDAYNRHVDAVNQHNRRVAEHNKKVIAVHNSQVNSVNDYNRQVDANNRKTAAETNRQLRTASGTIRYTQPERQLVDRVQAAVASIDSREYDTFLSYARIDGAVVAGKLQTHLENLGVSVWFDEVAIVPGRSQSRQMDTGLLKARSGIVLLTPAYLTGRFWTERELGALLSKDMLIPVLHNVTFEDVKQYSGILPDLAGFTTDGDSVEDIAEKIATAIMVSADEC